MVLLDESALGYPTHRWIAAGHLAEAESECINEFPVLAQMIRRERLIVMHSEDDSTTAMIEPLIGLATHLASEPVLFDTRNSKSVLAIQDEQVYSEYLRLAQMEV